ncbi:putative sulfite oxidase, mitochondrial [Folsomia candida]|uniref:sulfite oxidase n=1 Tax=Folsomia candida TaxID=158441 RepID=A0A226EEM2_FOLCA|nr:putative sulfite oxidase, mitochondrial [Folsomia candida]
MSRKSILAFNKSLVRLLPSSSHPIPIWTVLLSGPSTFRVHESHSHRKCYSQNHSSKFNYSSEHENASGESWNKSGIFGAFTGLTLAAYVAWRKSEQNGVHAATVRMESEEIKKDLPTYKSSEVAIWVTFKRGVYDVTEFVEKHPGGSRIMMAAGASLEPFWELYPVHQRPDVFQILAKYRIGNLSEEDVLEQQQPAEDHFKNEPKRHPVLKQRSLKPFNGETPPSILAEQFYTPNDVFYVRNHLPVPQVDVKSYCLEIEGISIKSSSLRLDDVKKFPKVTIAATIQCGGNRRSDMSKAKPSAGLAWSGGAIGNAKWTGASLKDILKKAGFDPKKYPHPEKVHVQFEGLDSDQSGECYGASIPLTYFLDENFEPVLAYEMNDKSIPIDHGFPLRVILPGIVGARSVKWLSRIIISNQESQSLWQQRDYKVFSPSVTMESVDFNSAPAIMDTPVTSYICSHEDGQVVAQGNIKMQGYAFSGGGRGIVRVEISKNRGNTWEVATIKHKAPSAARNWAWVMWEAEVAVNKQDKEIWVKAVDTGYNQQPEDFKNVWNYRGLVSTAYHKITLNVK